MFKPEQRWFSDLGERDLFELNVISENRNTKSQPTCHKIAVREQKPVNYTLTRIMEDFNPSDVQKQGCAKIVKDYVYVPERKLIA